MFHSNGWSFSWGMAAVGGTNICLRKFDVSLVCDLIGRYNVTHMCGAPVVLNMLSSSPNAKPLKNPVQFLTGGAPPPAAVLLRTESLGFVVSHGYGLTEAAGVVVSCAWKPNWNDLTALERATLKARQGVRTTGMTEVDVVDTHSGKRVKRDGLTLGEVVLKGGCVMLGYLKDPETTSQCIRSDGWLYTGDVGVIHSDGYLEIKRQVEGRDHKRGGECVQRGGGVGGLHERDCGGGGGGGEAGRVLGGDAVRVCERERWGYKWER